jgi:hypothetical protein
VDQLGPRQVDVGKAHVARSALGVDPFLLDLHFQRVPVEMGLAAEFDGGELHSMFLRGS